MIDTIILIGMAGVGKSSIGKAVAKKINYKFIDIDTSISQQFNKPLRNVIQEKGIDEFIKIEAEIVLKNIKKNTIIAPGGSLIYSFEKIYNQLNTTTIIYLKDTIANIKYRIPNLESRGIIGLENKTIEDIFNEREPLYTKYSDLTFDLSQNSFEKVTENIVNLVSLKK